MGQDAEGVWQRTLVAFMHAHGMSYAYWAWNADSGDTGGILNNDWTTVNQSKLEVLSAYQWPMLASSQSGSSVHSGNVAVVRNVYQLAWSK